ncbi:carboxymuconolactone decarboxylase family protein, partial [Sutterella wadsworthensis]
IEEAVFHASPYAGMARTRAVLAGVHAAMTAAGIALPLESRTVVSDENRLQKGIAVQTEIFGEQITRMHQTTPAERRSLMIDDLSGWCFGDFYTRKGLTIAERELATFCTIAALGGCEAQLSAHAAANLRCGNTKANLIDALQCAVVYLGFPRTLNACAVVDKVNL